MPACSSTQCLTPLHYTELVGIRTLDYFLEMACVAGNVNGERNILFYYLIAGTSPKEHAHFNLLDKSTTNTSACSTLSPSCEDGSAHPVLQCAEADFESAGPADNMQMSGRFKICPISAWPADHGQIVK
ncbi:hypothetical protein DFH07DRAFT_966605 [Mycena maculata]|uniref:Uncharacterized protein n=1 Tax=Mycena maculata TaxID=230809 RepID=A0AAD7I836_9AGAR|nr:hypothetical protein DFH07DRAFT_966605 [Mycena maculata]